MTSQQLDQMVGSLSPGGGAQGTRGVCRGDEVTQQQPLGGHCHVPLSSTPVETVTLIPCTPSSNFVELLVTRSMCPLRVISFREPASVVRQHVRDALNDTNGPCR